MLTDIPHRREDHIPPTRYAGVLRADHPPPTSHRQHSLSPSLSTPQVGTLEGTQVGTLVLRKYPLKFLTRKYLSQNFGNHVIRLGLKNQNPDLPCHFSSPNCTVNIIGISLLCS